VELCVSDEESWPLPEETYYIADIIGFQVFGDDDTALGTLQNVIRGSQDVLQVDGSFGELLIPFVEEWVGEVDTQARTIFIRNWRKLIDTEDE
jgi:16S rRNA processing protein RimM